MILLQPKTYFTQVVLKSGLFVILVYVTCLARKGASTAVQAVYLKLESAHRICDPTYGMYLRGLCYTGHDFIWWGSLP